MYNEGSMYFVQQNRLFRIFRSQLIVVETFKETPFLFSQNEKLYVQTKNAVKHVHESYVSESDCKL